MYDPEEYDFRTSHIFIEALGVGRPVIVSERTWMQNELQELGVECGVVSPYTSQGLADALLKCVDRRTTLVDNAIIVADTIRSTHNTTRFMETLLD